MRLALATDAEKRERDRLTWDAWGEALTPEQFRERERRLRGHAFARDDMQTWLLCDGEVLASCETYRMQSFLAGARGTTFAIASVYTEPRLRGRGHATALLRALHERLATESPHAQILFSDVGAPIYQRVGYVARPARDRVLAAGEAAVDVEWLQAPEPPAPPDGGFVIWPTAEQLDWHLERERTYAALLGRPKLRACGARAAGATMFWAADWKKQRLLVLLGESPELLAAARRVAWEAGLPEVVCWSDAGDTPRDGSLPMIRPCASGLSADAWTMIPRALWV